MTQIEHWHNLITSDKSEADYKTGLKKIYQVYKPFIAGITFTGHCPNNCIHCIFHPNFSTYNHDISIDQWKQVIQNVTHSLEVQYLIFNGRSITDQSIEFLSYVRDAVPNIQIGIIADGITLLPTINKLSLINPDWIDISIDGKESDHDTQRNRKGSFKKARETLFTLRDNDISNKINILTCFTSINKDSILECIQDFNHEGFNTFFISPINTFNAHPSEKLKTAENDLIQLINNIRSQLDSLHDVWIELNLYNIEHMRIIQKHDQDLWGAFKDTKDCLSWKMKAQNSIFNISYYPLSLEGTKEIAINCTGDVILPYAMALGEIPQQYRQGSLLSQPASEIVNNSIHSEIFEFYSNALHDEINIFKGGM